MAKAKVVVMTDFSLDDCNKVLKAGDDRGFYGDGDGDG